LIQAIPPNRVWARAGVYLVLSALVAVTSGACAETPGTLPPDVTGEENFAQGYEAQEIMLGDVALLVPSDWYVQTEGDYGQVQRVLASPEDPHYEGIEVVGGLPLQEPLEGPVIELSRAVFYVGTNGSSSLTIEGVSEKIRVFQLVGGRRKTTVYYLPARNVLITTKYETSEEHKLIDDIVSSLRIHEATP